MAEANPNIAAEAAAPAGRRRGIRMPFGRRAGELSPHSSRIVGLLKLVLPLIALTLISLIVIWPQLRDDPHRFRLGATHVDPSEASVLRMINPRYLGVDADNQPFVLTADSAIQDPVNADLMRLVQPKADLTMKDGSWVAMAAPAGIYDRVRQTVHLSDGVNVFQDSGYAFFSPSADIDLIVGSASGDEAVEGQGPFGHLTAAGFRILERGRRVVFIGQSHLTLRGEGSSKPPVQPARSGKRVSG
jgi:lipopolysaccharide export system protein LptC